MPASAGPELGAAGRRPTWLEGFYDLVFAFAVTQLAGRLERDASPLGVAGFVFLFIAVWWAWVGTTVYFDRFDRGQRWLRFAIGAQLLAVAALAVHVGDALESGSRDFALAYALIRLVLVGLYWDVLRREHDERRAIARHYALGFGAAAAIWLASALAPVPARFAVWAVAMVVDYATPLTARHLQARVQLDPSHLPERFGLFTLIVLGESIAASAGSLAGRSWDVPAAVGGALGIAAAFGIWWSYFDHLERAPVRRTRLAGQVWFYGHLPFLMAMTALAVGIRELIGGSDQGRVIAVTATVLTLVLVATVRLTAAEGARPAIGIMVGTVVGALAAVVASISGSAVLVLAALAVACALPGGATELSARWPGLPDETGG
ncbi:MAG TPA: low temperature requirement protein A [Candidatus Dormibacteraeota bacterium]|nr:low temperature requirement protein A [Candidatus Dormibacteraeota bacterium]